MGQVVDSTWCERELRRELERADARDLRAGRQADESRRRIAMLEFEVRTLRAELQSQHRWLARQDRRLDGQQIWAAGLCLGLLHLLIALMLLIKAVPGSAVIREPAPAAIPFVVAGFFMLGWSAYFAWWSD